MPLYNSLFPNNEIIRQPKLHKSLASEHFNLINTSGALNILLLKYKMEI